MEKISSAKYESFAGVFVCLYACVRHKSHITTDVFTNVRASKHDDNNRKGFFLSIMPHSFGLNHCIRFLQLHGGHEKQTQGDICSSAHRNQFSFPKHCKQFKKPVQITKIHGILHIKKEDDDFISVNAEIVTALVVNHSAMCVQAEGWGACARAR